MSRGSAGPYPKPPPLCRGPASPLGAGRVCARGMDVAGGLSPFNSHPAGVISSLDVPEPFMYKSCDLTYGLPGDLSPCSEPATAGSAWWDLVTPAGCRHSPSGGPSLRPGVAEVPCCRWPALPRQAGRTPAFLHSPAWPFLSAADTCRSAPPHFLGSLTQDKGGCRVDSWLGVSAEAAGSLPLLSASSQGSGPCGLWVPWFRDLHGSLPAPHPLVEEAGSAGIPAWELAAVGRVGVRPATAT